MRTASAGRKGLRVSAQRAIEGSALEPPARFLWRTVSRKTTARRLLAPTRNDIYDQLTVAVMTVVLSSKSNCVDAGAHTGKLLAQMVRLAPDGCHHAFEPLPECAAVLRERFDSVSVHQCALADNTTTGAFHWIRSCPEYSGLDLRRAGDYDEASVDIIDVPVLRLDDVLPSNQRVDFIKIDVEGAEARLLRGARRTLRSWHPLVVVEMGPNPLEAYRELTESGYKMYLLDGWLGGEDPLTESMFKAELYHHWYYLACA
jgi:FkbM family methyltransferase